jgi:circadian clock protein KaiB
MKRNLLKLFVTGRTQRSQEAVRNLNLLYRDRYSSRYDLVVVDVLENPDQAEEERILATPTLIRYTREGSRRIIGDLSNTEEVEKLLRFGENESKMSEES